MQRLPDGRIVITDEEATRIAEYINSSLDREWDQYTNQYICTDKWEDGKRRMNPEMYDLSQQLNLL